MIIQRNSLFCNRNPTKGNFYYEAEIHNNNSGYLRSNRCSKTEAALLCALDYCSDKLKAQRKVKKLEALNAEYEMRISELEEELEELKNNG